MIKKLKRWLYLRRADFSLVINIKTDAYVLLSYDKKGNALIEAEGHLDGPGDIIPLPINIPLNRMKTVFC